MANPLEGIMPLFRDYTPMQFAIRQYCANTIAQRICKFGWEPHINGLEPRLLLLLAMCMPLHTRKAIILFAWQKAAERGLKDVTDFLELYCPGLKMVPQHQITPDMTLVEASAL